MTEAVARFVAAHAAASGTQSRQYADPFVSTNWAIVEIAAAIDAARRHAVALQAGRVAKSLATMIEAQAQLDRLIAQASQLSQTVGRVLAAHADRDKGAPE